MIDTEWFLPQQYPKRSTILPLILWAIVIGLTLGGVLYAGKAYGQAMFMVQSEGVTVTLYKDPCELKQVSNLPHKATWTDKGETFSGCWGARPDLGMVVAFFSDGAVALIPMQHVKRVHGA